MIRIKISNFIKKYKDKIRDFIKKIIIVAMVVLIATIMLSSFSSIEQEEKKNTNTVYNPTDTIISGSNVPKEQYKQDSNLVNTFLELCNNGKIEDAYSYLSDECKQELFPTIQEFKEHYYEYIFNRKRQCNLQSWISTADYTVYRVRYTNNMLATGTYDEGNVYQDYITLSRKDNTEKISIGSFIDSEDCSITTKKEGIEAKVVNKKTYISDEEYEIYIKNNTDKIILLDDLKSNSTIWLVASGIQYGVYTNKLFVSSLTIEPGETTRVIMRFMKTLGSNNASDNIQFLKVIKDYDAYLENEKDYTDFTNIKIKVRD